MALRFHNLSVASIEAETDDAVSVSFDIPENLKDRFRHSPGQYLTLSHDFPSGNARRTYSIHEPADGPCSVLVKRVQDGLFSGFVHDELQPGDAIDVLEPTGTFGHGIDYAKENRVFACAAGSGITPVLPIIDTVLAGNPKSSVIFIYSNKATSSIIFRERLCDLKNMHMDRLEVVHVLTKEKTDIPLLSGRIDARHASQLIDAFADGTVAGMTCLLCGPEELMDTMEGVLVKHGARKSQIQRERFNAPKVPAKKAKKASSKANGSCHVEVVLNGTRNSFDAKRGNTLLESIRAHGLEAPFSCTGGVCSTCRARLREGSVAMDVNYALDDDEVKNRMILTCQSRPTSDSVVVDFDSLWG